MPVTLMLPTCSAGNTYELFGLGNKVEAIATRSRWSARKVLAIRTMREVHTRAASGTGRHPIRSRILIVFTAAAALFIAATKAPLAAADESQLAQLWQEPSDLSSRDLFHGPWGAKNAPDPAATYTFLKPKETGVNPGVVVRDPQGRTWHVKQSPLDDDKESSIDAQGAEGPVEVTVSRILSAVGYHQPPVYFLPEFTMTDASGTRRLPGGRFRLETESLHKIGEWPWSKNPFVGARPYNGLLVILLMFNSWDLKDDNNTLYEVRNGGAVNRWYVVRDLGAALGETGRFNSLSRRWNRAKRNDIDTFERHTFIEGVEDGFVKFAYQGRQPELVRHRITVEDLQWASDLLGRLSDTQWRDAFRAGGYEPALADRFIRKIKDNVAAALKVTASSNRTSLNRR